VITCTECGKETANPKFCSSACAARYNNRVYIKRPLTKRCKTTGCNALIPSRLTYCLACQTRRNKEVVRKKPQTIADIQRLAKYQKNAVIRNDARRVYRRSGRPLACTVCGYRNHVEVCHIRPIERFSETMLISEVNSLENLICLCPNHHWELDHGLLSF
jgi:hypothetical protein